MTLIKCLVLLFSICLSLTCHAQKSYGAILDTMVVNNRKVVVFSNKRWAYIDDYSKSLAYDSIFNNNWQTKEIYAYCNEKNHTTEAKTIDLHENNSSFVFPLDSFKFGRGFNNNHTGLDLKAPLGDSIRTAFDGRIRFAGNMHNGYGNLVIIRHFNSLETYYSHLSKIMVDIDDDVKAGEVIGLIGQSGKATGYHLHFETRYLDKPFDPLRFISLQEKKIISDSLLICDSLFKTNNLYPASGEMMSLDTVLQFHTVVKGDTLYKISVIYGTTIENLCQLNNISRNSVLHIGQELKITP